MKEGDVLLASLPQRDGTLKDRPALFLQRMPPFQDFLVYGRGHRMRVSTADVIPRRKRHVVGPEK